MKLLHQDGKYLRSKQVDGKSVFVEITESEFKALSDAQQQKKSIIRSATNGAAMAGGVAVGEVALAGAASAAEVAVTAVEAVSLIPTVLTLATIGGVAYLGYKAVKFVTAE
jgi:hypothetical protein